MKKYRIKKSMLRQILASRGTSHNDFADQLGISKSSFSRYVNLHRKMEIEIAYTIAKKLGVSMEELYEWDDELNDDN